MIHHVARLLDSETSRRILATIRIPQDGSGVHGTKTFNIIMRAHSFQTTQNCQPPSVSGTGVLMVRRFRAYYAQLAPGERHKWQPREKIALI